MPNYSRKIVYLSEAQKAELFTNHTITVNGTTITYNENDLYVTPQEQPYIKPSTGIPASDLATGVVKVSDVQVNNNSIVSNGIATMPMASTSSYGVVKISGGLYIGNSGIVQTNRATVEQIKAGIHVNNPITPSFQEASVFYGLTKAAGVDMASSSNAVGTYTDDAKDAIQNMLGITDLISTEESSTATAAHAINSTFMMNGKLHRATAAIVIGDAVEVGTNCEVVKADEVFVKNTDIATRDIYGLVKIGDGLGINTNTGKLQTNSASATTIQQGSAGYAPIVPGHQHEAVFYGLSKVAGVDLKNETVTLGTYPETSKTAIRSLIGAAASSDIPNIPVQDVQINGSSILSSGIANVPLASNDNFGVVKTGSFGIRINNDGILYINPATIQSEVKPGAANYLPIVPSTQHAAVYYGLSKVAGVDLASETVTVGTYPETSKTAIRNMLGAVGDVQINGTSVVSNGVANIPIAILTNAQGEGQYGLVKINQSNGITIAGDGCLSVNRASETQYKGGSNNYLMVTPYGQHMSVFYGLAKAAGDTTMASSSNAVGTYTETAKAAIRDMLGVETSVELIETISSTTPTIVGQPNVTYQCGEVSTISITPPANGTIDIYFTSGTTATVLTAPSTIKWPAWFDVEALEPDTIYELMITNGTYGSVMTWQS